MEIPSIYDTNDSLRTAYLYTEGVKIAAAEGAEMAQPYFQRVLQIDSLHAPALYQRGSFFGTAEPLLSQQYLESAYKADTTNLEYMGAYGYALLSNGDYMASRSIYERLTKRDPRDGRNHLALALLYEATNLPYMAIATLDSAEYRLGRAKEFTELKRDLLIRVGLIDRAIEEAQIAVQNNPRDTQGILSLARLHMGVGNSAKAEELLLGLLAFDATNTYAQLLLVDLYHNNKAPNKELEAIKQAILNEGLEAKAKVELYNKAVEERGIDFISGHFFAVNSIVELLHMKYPDNYDVALIYARHKFRMGEREEALSSFVSILERFPEQMEAYSWVYELHWALGNHDEAFRALSKAIERFPNEESFSLRKAYWLHEIGAPLKEVERVVKAAIGRTADPKKRSSLYTSLGDFQQNPNKAFRNYKKALQYDPENSSALNNWAYFSAIYGGNLEEALRMSTRACEITPNNPNYLDTKGWILHLLGNNKEAKRVLRQAISLDTTGEGTFLLHFGDILAAEGDRFMAELYYKRALEAGEDAQAIQERLDKLNTTTTK